jgi:squalene/oxidosqualene cyclase-like protein
MESTQPRAHTQTAMRGSPTDLDRAIEKGLAQLAATQHESGAWLGDYGGPLFLLPMYLGTSEALGLPLTADTKAEMIRYLRGVQNDDGGFGLHVESHSYQFCSTIIYASMRLAGVERDDPCLVRARAYIRKHGGPLTAAAWGKFFLTLLNLYDYRGLNPVPPELWLLPRALPFHPARLWCHSRMVMLPMSYLYGARVQLPETERTREIREELYDLPYARVPWEKGRELIAPSDAYTKVSEPMRAAHRVLLAYEARPSAMLRHAALAEVLEQVSLEDENTNYVCLGPVNKLLNMWVWHHARPHGVELPLHMERLPEYLWHGPDGVKMQGYHSSQLWDTCFAVQAVYAAEAEREHAELLDRAHRFVADNQVEEDLPNRERSYRDPTRGGFCFSAKDNGWIVSDCTAEGLRTLLRFADARPVPQQSLRDAVGYLLWSQMPCGGWASYEPARGPAWLELLNVADVFGDTMIDYPYVECTASVLQAFQAFRQRDPEFRADDLEAAITRGRDFLFTKQRADGSFEGSWGICFTYGTWFGIKGLRAAGLPASHPAIAQATAFLREKQLPDGGWGETAGSSYERRYIHTREGQAVMTSWALLGLIAGGEGASESVARGVRFLVQRMGEDGAYRPEHIAGMFNKTCAIHYDNYLKYFPLWALGEARSHGAA